jgi:TolB protein
MKHCPKCGHNYADETLNFCLEDGEWLTAKADADEPVTAVLPEGISSPGKTSSERETQIYSSGDFVSGQLKNNKFRSGAVAVVGLIVLAGFSYGLYKFFGGQTKDVQRSNNSINTVRLTGDGKARGVEISPDGKFLAYIRTEGGERSIWLKQIQPNINIAIVKPGELDDFDDLVFSHDGNFVYFSAKSKEEQAPSTYRVATLGGAPTKVVEDGYSVRFSADGKHLSFTRVDLKANESSIIVADGDGRNERKLASRSAKQFFVGPTAWSPDGRSLAAPVGDDALPPGKNAKISMISVDDGSVTELADVSFLDIYDLVWHPSGDSLIVAARETTLSQPQLWEVSYPSQSLRRLTNNLNGHTSVSITSDGNAIVTGEIYAKSAIWVSPDLKPENAKPIMPATGDTFGFAWTPDNRIVYVSEQTGDTEVWIMNDDGGNAKALTSDRFFKTVPVVSPDGRYIVYASIEGGGTLVRIDIDGGGKTDIVAGIGADNPDISPDGKWVIFSAWIDGISRVMRTSIDGGPPQVLKDWAIEPRYSRDGSRIACFTPEEKTKYWRRLAIIPADGGAEIDSFLTPANTNIGRGPVWTPDDKAISVVIAPGENQELWMQPVDGNPGKQVTHVGVPGIARRDYSRDGKRIAIVRAQGFGNAIMITDFR